MKNRERSERTQRTDASQDMLLCRAATAARAGAWQWNSRQRTVSWTETLRDLLDLGTDPFEGSPESFAARVHPDDRERVQSGLQDVLANGRAYDDDARALRCDGAWHWLRIHAERETFDATHPSAESLVATVVCIDAQKRNETALQESQERFAKLFDTRSISVTISTMESGRLVEVNDAFCKLTRFSREQAIGRTTLELGIWPSTDDRDAIIAALSGAQGVRNRVVRLRAADGEARVGLLSAERILIDGQPHVLTTFDDITIRERAQAALRSSEERLRLALRGAGAGVWQMNLQTNEIFWSDEFRDLYGYDRSVTPGRETWAQHLHPDDRERMLNDLRTRLKPGTDEYRREFRILHPTRGLRWILALGQIGRNETGRALTMTGISIDITRIKEVERELREADERKNEFLAVLSHELRNPLAPLRNGIEILRLTNGTGEVADKAREMMARQLEQMVRLIDDLLEVSRISRGKIELKRSPIKLTQALQHALEVSKPLIDAAGHDLTIDIPPGPLIVDADLTRLSQVFGNLLNNAAKYTNAHGRIWLTVTRLPAHVRVSVRDSGIGVPPEGLRKIFEMFTQLDTSVHRQQGGLGIGLSVAKRLVEMHGGTLTAVSEGLGKGCEFIVELPLHVPASNDPNFDNVAKTSDSHPLRILVADDNQDAAASLSLVLEMHGHEVRTAHDGLTALRIAEAYAPEVAVLDIGMPGLDGYEVCRNLRTLPAGNDMLIIALTGWGQAEDKAKAQQAGFDQHLVKPGDVAELEEMMRQRRKASSQPQ